MDKKIYISGKISGLPAKEAVDKFEKAEDYLKSVYPNATIVNPFKVKHLHDKSWENYMRYDLIEMLSCTSIYMLTNWKQSEGAKIEFNLAIELKFEILFEK